MHGQEIPGAPGFYAPKDMTPEEFQAWLARVRFGGSSMTGDASSIPDDDPAEGNIPNYTPPSPPTELERQAAVNQVDPQVVKQFLATMSQPAPSLDNSFTINEQAKMGHASPNYGPPQTMAEYDQLRPPETYDLPQDILHRQMFNERIKAQGVLDAADQRGEAAMAVAGAKQAEAEAKLKAASLQESLGRLYGEHPELIARTPQAARTVTGNPIDPDGRSVIEGLMGSSQGHPQSPPIGKQVTPGITPERDVHPGDWTIRAGRKYIYDGRSWSPI